MTARIDLITGFLGAGKTAFIQRCGEWLRRGGVPYVVVENEFGVANVDSAMLKSDGAQVVELSGGCICCGLKRDFRVLLGDLSRPGLRIVVEPSGIFNPHDFFDVALDPTLRDKCVLGTVITVVDPHALQGMDGGALEILREQAGCSGMVVVSKTGGMSPGELGECTARVRNMLVLDADFPVEARPWEQFDEADFGRFFGMATAPAQRKRREWNHAAMFESRLVFGVAAFSEDEIRECVATFFSDAAHDGAVRVKGYLKAERGGYYEINCTPGDRLVRLVDVKTRPFLTVIGKKLDRERLAETFKSARVG